MSYQLKSDVWDEDRVKRYLFGYLPETHPFYSAALGLLHRMSTRSSADSVGQRLRVYLRYLADHTLDPVAVTRDDLETYLGTYRHRSPATVESHLSLLRSLYEEALDRDLVLKNPARRIRLGAYEPRTARALSLEQAQALLDAARAELSDPDRRLIAARDYFILAACLTMGFRQRELLRITFGDFDFSGDYPVVEIYGKFRKHARHRLTPLVEEALAVWIRLLEECIGRPLTLGDALLVPLAAGDLLSLRKAPATRLHPMSGTALYWMVHDRLANIGVSGPKGTHRLRKTAATLMWEAKADPEDIRRAMNHRKISTTYRHYIAPAEELEHSAPNLIPLKPAGLA